MRDGDLLGPFSVTGGLMQTQAHIQFGAGQAIFVDGDALHGGSDRRRDGYAAGV